MSEDKRDPWQELHDAWDVLFMEIAHTLRIPQIVEWISRKLEKK